MKREPSLTPFQLLPTLLPEIEIDAGTFIGIRRQIHSQPELGFEVGATAKLVAMLLEKWGYDVHTGIGKSGVVGQLKVGSGKRRLGIRADMDALPIVENTGLPYASQTPGKMHARGPRFPAAHRGGAARQSAFAARGSMARIARTRCASLPARGSGLPRRGGVRNDGAKRL